MRMPSINKNDISEPRVTDYIMILFYPIIQTVNKATAYIVHHHERGTGYPVANINIIIDYDETFRILNTDCIDETLYLVDSMEGKWVLTSNDHIIKIDYSKNGQKTQQAILPVDKNIDALRVLCSLIMNQRYKLFTPVILLLIIDGQEKNVKIDPKVFNYKTIFGINEMPKYRLPKTVYS